MALIRSTRHRSRQKCRSYPRRGRLLGGAFSRFPQRALIDPGHRQISGNTCPWRRALLEGTQQFHRPRGLRRLRGSVPAPSPSVISERIAAGTTLRATLSTAAAPPAASAKRSEDVVGIVVQGFSERQQWLRAVNDQRPPDQRLGGNRHYSTVGRRCGRDKLNSRRCVNELAAGTWEFPLIQQARTAAHAAGVNSFRQHLTQMRGASIGLPIESQRAPVDAGSPRPASHPTHSAAQPRAAHPRRRKTDPRRSAIQQVAVKSTIAYGPVTAKMVTKQCSVPSSCSSAKVVGTFETEAGTARSAAWLRSTVPSAASTYTLWLAPNIERAAALRSPGSSANAAIAPSSPKIDIQMWRNHPPIRSAW